MQFSPVAPIAAPDTASPWVVIDTNAWLDLLLFDDLRAQPLWLALQGGQLRAVATQPMLDELADVLTRPFIADWPVAAETVLARAQALCCIVDAVPTPDRLAPRCRDLDDQKFIDLAWAWPAAWLLSRDRALLTLARSASPRGLRITTPAGWAAHSVPSAAA
ncbi:MAG: putative toxin-antitoxin system toxin component, PIN family [Burkholderiales bacterium RIFCSPHIGHO2_12_FULL_69_20]|nr:MAG: putative toxin-antitoxin system toxin component, PIN family [Burkholderiales bacterium RIFCSPHIGHO2_12_FULL_69_20]